MVHPPQDEVPSVEAKSVAVVFRHDEDLRITYDVLRWMMIGLPALLFVVTFSYALRTGSFEGSISAYYGGPVRDVFVGVVIATAACMVAYRGWFALEDFALNAAGFFAVFVGLVPAGLGTIMSDLRERDEALAALATSEALTGELPAALENAAPAFTAEQYGWSLRIALTAVALLCAWWVRNDFKQSRHTLDLLDRGGASRGTAVCLAAVALCFSVLTYWQLWLTGPADRISLPGITVGPLHLDVHAIAASLMIAALLVVVASHGWPEQAARADPGRSVQPADHRLRHVYRTIFGLMLIGALGLAGLGVVFFPERMVLTVEWYEIFLFCWFWALETRRVSRGRHAVEEAAE
ncbi:hypothetical protein [Arthrobacter pityocampae]|uniref:hypothetical protein n=1 Tax=Arthrobacter pityocampae TaxID=547334 RepID=UPI003734C5E1